jgi:hypothetical protein
MLKHTFQPDLIPTKRINRLTGPEEEVAMDMVMKVNILHHSQDLWQALNVLLTEVPCI